MCYVVHYYILQTVRGFCKVPYYYEELSYINDFSESDSNVYHNFGGNHYGADKRTRHSGVFEELMELDIIDNSFEKFDVPAFEDVMGASVVHDFHKVKFITPLFSSQRDKHINTYTYGDDMYQFFCVLKMHYSCLSK